MSENDETIITPQEEQPEPEDSTDATEPSAQEAEVPVEETFLSGLEEFSNSAEAEQAVEDEASAEQIAEEPIPPIDLLPDDSPALVEPSPSAEGEKGGTNWLLLVVIVLLVVICCCCLVVIGLALMFFSIGSSTTGDFYSNVIMVLTHLLA